MAESLERSGASDASPGLKIRRAMEGGVRAFEAEIADVPDDPANYAHAAEWLVGLWCYGFCTRTESFDRARQLVDRGLQLGVPSAHLSTLHGVLCMGDWQWSQAARAFDQAFEQDADMAMTHHWHALMLSARGAHAQAIAASERAVALDPSVGNRVGLGASLYFARDFERMAAQMQAVVEEDPDFAEAYDWLGMALVQLERFDESLAAYEKAYTLSDGLAEINAGRGHAYGMAGKHEEATAIAQQLERQAERGTIPPVQQAFVYLSLGDHALAWQALDRAQAERSWELAFVSVEPWLDDLRQQPRFQALESLVWAEK